MSGAINAIGLEFADGTKSPIFQTESAKNEEIKKITVDPNKDISQIRMTINPQQHLLGLAFICKNDKMQPEIFWDHTNQPWYEQQGRGYQTIEKDIPDGMEIIGVRCSTRSCQKEIPRIGFISWKPRRYWRAFENGVPEVLPPTKSDSVIDASNNEESAT